MSELKDSILDIDIFSESEGSGSSLDSKLNDKDAAKIQIPSKTEISVSVYNDAITRLQKSFKESSEALESIKNLRVVDDEPDVDALQESYIEDMLMEAYMDGPMFESVSVENKDEIKAINKKIRKKFTSLKRTLSWYTSKTVVGEKLGLLDPFIFVKANKKLQMHAWQIVSTLFPARGGMTIKEALESLTEEFKEDLGDYKFDVIQVNAFISPFGASKLSDEEKESKRKLYKVYLLIIDSADSEPIKDIEIELTGKDAETLKMAMDKVSDKE